MTILQRTIFFYLFCFSIYSFCSDTSDSHDSNNETNTPTDYIRHKKIHHGDEGYPICITPKENDRQNKKLYSVDLNEITEEPEKIEHAGCFRTLLRIFDKKK